MLRGICSAHPLPTSWALADGGSRRGCDKFASRLRGGVGSHSAEFTRTGTGGALFQKPAGPFRYRACFETAPGNVANKRAIDLVPYCRIFFKHIPRDCVRRHSRTAGIYCQLCPAESAFFPARGLPPAPRRGSSPYRCVRANVGRTPSQKVVKRMSEQCRSNPCETCAAGTADHPRLVGIIPERALLPVSRLNPTSCSNLPATMQRQGGVG